MVYRINIFTINFNSKQLFGFFKIFYFWYFIAKSLGHTAFVPEDDIYSRTKSQLLAQMDVAMGGRVAEELS